MHRNMAAIELKLIAVSCIYYIHSLENNSKQYLNILNETNKQNFRLYHYIFFHLI